MAERTFVAELVVPATPWDVFALLTDDQQQGQWRTRFERHAPVVEEDRYTRIVFEDRLLIELEPSGSGTLIRGIRTKEGDGPFGVIGLWFTSRRSAEAEMEAQLGRIGATLQYGAI